MTTEYMIPPAPNWYASTALSATFKFIAYASQNQIVIVGLCITSKQSCSIY